MQTEERRQRARQASEGRQAAPEEAARLALRLFSRVPEPPLYRRRDEPGRAVAAALLDDVTEVLTVLYAVERDEGPTVFTRAVELHLEALCLTSVGDIEAAQRPWHEAVAAERAAVAAARGWQRPGVSKRPVFEGGVSRYDPSSASVLRVSLPCPGCRQVSEQVCATSGGPQPVSCPRCHAHFFAYLADVRSLEVVAEGRTRRYVFRLEGLAGGNQARLETVDASRDVIDVGPRDTVAFLYAPESELRGVVDVTSKRVWWLVTPGACFVATAVFGSTAPELDVLRTFRDEVLEASAAGRWFVDTYYRHGPSWAVRVKRSAWVAPMMRGVLRVFVAFLQRSVTCDHPNDVSSRERP